MTATEDIEENTTPKGGKRGMIVALLLALGLGAGGFYAAYSGLLPIAAGSSSEAGDESAKETLKPIENNAYVPLDPLIVNIRSSSKYNLLRFVGQLEIESKHANDIEALKPRIMDVMNTYLNALEAARFEDPTAMIKLRAQLLRRIQIVTGDGRVQDLLIMEFLLQ